MVRTLLNEITPKDRTSTLDEVALDKHMGTSHNYAYRYTCGGCPATKHWELAFVSGAWKLEQFIWPGHVWTTNVFALNNWKVQTAVAAILGLYRAFHFSSNRTKASFHSFHYCPDGLWPCKNVECVRIPSLKDNWHVVTSRYAFSPYMLRCPSCGRLMSVPNQGFIFKRNKLPTCATPSPR